MQLSHWLTLLQAVLVTSTTPQLRSKVAEKHIQVKIAGNWRDGGNLEEKWREKGRSEEKWREKRNLEEFWREERNTEGLWRENWRKEGNLEEFWRGKRDTEGISSHNRREEGNSEKIWKENGEMEEFWRENWRKEGNLEGKARDERVKERERRREIGERERTETGENIGGKSKLEEEKKKEEEEVSIWIIPSFSSSSSSSSSSSNKQEDKQTTTKGRQQDTITVAGNFSLEIRSKRDSLLLDLHPNRELLSHTYMKTGGGGGSGGGGGQVWCDYLGTVRGDLTSLVAVSVCQGLRGVIVTQGRWKEVYPAQHTHTLRGPHLLDTHPQRDDTRTCGVKGEVSHHHHHQQQQQGEEGGMNGLRKRVERSLRGDLLWTQKNTSYVELVVVVDHTLYNNMLNHSTSAAAASSSSSSSFSSSISKRVQAITNVLNVLYRPLGIIIVLTHLEIWDREDKVQVVDQDSEATLHNFKAYLHTFKDRLPNLQVDNMQLLTGVDFENNTVGKGTVAGMCGSSSVGVAMDGVRSSILATAEVVAHEMGHNFGLRHVDEVEGCDCEGDNCIMKSTGIGSEWSRCSRENISLALPSLSLECLRNTPLMVAEWDGGESNCGNYLREGEEECDCGPSSYCTNPCCDAKTCKLVGNATCATGPCCDVETCRPYTSSLVVCRRALSECDITEYCNGGGEECVADNYVRDGTACDGGQGYCYLGKCGSGGSRCVQVWGEGATLCSGENVHRLNVLGQRAGNCGYEDSKKEKLKPCDDSNAQCGTLFCRTPKATSPGSDFYHTLWQSEEQCRAVLAAPTYPQSAWLVPNGAACGDGKMCVDQECIARPWALGSIIFLVVFIITIILVFLLWDHIRHCWEREGGRHCCITHFYYCGTCLDSCCCPCMNRINRLLLSVLPGCSCPKVRVTGKEVAREANGDVVSCRDVSGVAAVLDGPKDVGVVELQPDFGFAGSAPRLEFSGSGTRGVTFTPISPGSYASTPPPVIPMTATPLLHPMQESPSLSHPQFTPQDTITGDFSMAENPAENASLTSPPHITPARPAPPPPGKPTHTHAHGDTHTDTGHAHRPTPVVPPRPITTQPLRPPLPHSPAPPLVPPHPEVSLVRTHKPPLPPKP